MKSSCMFDNLVFGFIKEMCIVYSSYPLNPDWAQGNVWYSAPKRTVFCALREGCTNVTDALLSCSYMVAGLKKLHHWVSILWTRTWYPLVLIRVFSAKLLKLNVLKEFILQNSVLLNVLHVRSLHPLLSANTHEQFLGVSLTLFAMWPSPAMEEFRVLLFQEWCHLQWNKGQYRQLNIIIQRGIW